MIEFDKQISRKDTESVKWDAIAETYQMDDLLPLWVADMDFLSPGGVAKAFSEYIKHGIFGYATLSDKLYQAIIHWERQHHAVELTKENIVYKWCVNQFSCSSTNFYKTRRFYFDS